jgi:hypothetical protein
MERAWRRANHVVVGSAPLASAVAVNTGLCADVANEAIESKRQDVNTLAASAEREPVQAKEGGGTSGVRLQLSKRRREGTWHRGV